MKAEDRASPEEILSSIIALESQLADEATGDAHEEELFAAVDQLTDLLTTRELALRLVLADTQLRKLTRPPTQQ